MAELVMPSLGADMSAGTLARRVAPVGASLARGDIYAEVETDKGVIAVETFAAGRLVEWLVEEGQKVPVGTPLARLEVEEAGVSPSSAAALPPEALAPPAQDADPGHPPAVEASGGSQHTSVPRRPSAGPPSTPSARRVAREEHRDLSAVHGSGSHGRVGLLDLHPPAPPPAAEAREDTPPAAPPAPALTTPDPATSGAPSSRLRVTPVAKRRAAVLGVDLTTLRGSGAGGAIRLVDVETAAPAPPDPSLRMRAAIGAAMSRSKREIPHYYLAHEVDLGAAMAWLGARNASRPPSERVLPAALIVRAVALGLRRAPELNACYVDGRSVPQPDVHVGLAIALRGGGLVAPRIERTDTLSLDALMSAMTDLVARARRGGLRASEMGNATITITSLGERGVDLVVPVITPPQVAIVGVGTISERPRVVDAQVVPRPVVTISLAADHRVSDGHGGARFLRHVGNLLESPENL